MMTRFSTLSDAAIFATKLRDEGHFAEIVHLHASHLWGSHPAWGIPVIHSEPEARDLTDLPEDPGSRQWLKVIVLGVPLLCGLLIVAGYAALLVEPLRGRLGAVPVLALIALLTGMVALLFARALQPDAAELDEVPDATRRLCWLAEPANRACGVILAIATVCAAALGVFMLLGLLAAVVSAPLLGLSLVLGLAALAGAVALGHFIVRAHRDPQPDLHSAVVVGCQGVTWYLLMALLLLW